jgi:sucrose-6-phosphate hydrolase SacC (GH32 family)
MTVYEGNPVIGHINGSNRDPKVIWHTPTAQWVMALYLDDKVMAFFTSKDLKSWEFQSKIKCFHECPELFALPVDGDKSNEKWILYGASGHYLIGQFDGKEFKSETDAIDFQYGNCFYASQTFTNIPESDGRRIQIAWGRVKMPGMPFNQMMLFPATLTLRSTDEGIRMFAKPIREIESLHRDKRIEKNKALKPDDIIGCSIDELARIRAVVRPTATAETRFAIRDVPVTYNAQKQELSCLGKKAPLKQVGGKIKLDILVDRTSIEIFGNNGRVYMPIGVILTDKPKSLEISTGGGNTELELLEVVQFSSTWR